MNEFLPKELKDYIAQNQDTLVKLLDTLCRIPAPSNHEELRAEFIRDWFEKEGCKGSYIDSSLKCDLPVPLRVPEGPSGLHCPFRYGLPGYGAL